MRRQARLVQHLPGGEREDGAHGDDPLEGVQTQVAEDDGEGRLGVLQVVGPHEGEHRGDAAVRDADDGQRQHDRQRDVAPRVLGLLTCGKSGVENYMW